MIMIHNGAMPEIKMIDVFDKLVRFMEIPDHDSHPPSGNKKDLFFFRNLLIAFLDHNQKKPPDEKQIRNVEILIHSLDGKRKLSFENFFDEDHRKVNEEVISLLAHIDIGKFLVSPSVWMGVVVCGLFVTAAIYVRRYRDES